jgi:transketolase
MSKTKNQRIAYGETITELGGENPNIVALEADLGKSTMSFMFGEKFPGRYFEMGIAEANMMSTAAGLAASGKIAFCSTFAVFASGRAYDQIRQTIAIGELNVKICGSSSGLSDFGDGSTHQAIEDVAIMCAIPNMTVLTPCDATEARKAVRAAARIDGPVYLRIIRNDVPDYTSEADEFEVGKVRVMKEGADVAIFAHGAMIDAAMKARAALEDRGVSAAVVNAGTMKPFDNEGVKKIAGSVKAVITAEEHTYIGGLASHVALALRGMGIPMDYVAVEDEFGQSAKDVKELQTHYGVTAERIAEKALALL